MLRLAVPARVGRSPLLIMAASALAEGQEPDRAPRHEAGTSDLGISGKAPECFLTLTAHGRAGQRPPTSQNRWLRAAVSSSGGRGSDDSDRAFATHPAVSLRPRRIGLLPAPTAFGRSRIYQHPMPPTGADGRCTCLWITQLDVTQGWGTGMEVTNSQLRGRRRHAPDDDI